MATKNIRIKKDDIAPESAELLAKSVIMVAEGYKQVLESPLKQRGLIVLLHDIIGTSNITKSQIKLVLEALPRLRAWYIK